MIMEAEGKAIKMWQVTAAFKLALEKIASTLTKQKCCLFECPKRRRDTRNERRIIALSGAVEYFTRSRIDGTR